jgi:hypothetical protein
VFEELLRQAEMNRLGRQCGVIERQRKLNLAMLVRAIVVSAGMPGRAYQADILRVYLESEVPRVTRWDNIAELLTHAETDPNWRRRPSVLDQLRGWKRQPVARDKNRTHRPQMAA